MNILNLIATSTFGLEAVVARELEQLGYENPRVEDGKVRFQGTVRDIARCNLWLRSSDRVVIEMDCFEAADFDTLFDRTKELPWEEWISVDAKFPVTGKSVHSQLSATPSVQKTVKKAIVERLRKTHNRHWFEETGAEYKVDIHLFKDTASITLDTSGPGLHKRGYRDLQGIAPIKETLAAGMLLLSFWKPGRPFIDPFCGTGTIPIEAAMIGLNMAPGINRSFVSEDWPQIPRGLWKDVRAEANDLRQRSLPVPLIGCDIDRKVCRKAEHHIRQAFYDSSFAFPPAQLEGCVGSTDGRFRPRGPVGMRFAFRSTSLGAVEWFIDAPTGMNGSAPWTAEEKAAVKAAVTTYKAKIRPLVRNADLYHILPRPDGKNWDGIQYYDPAAGKGVVYLFKPAAVADTITLKLRGVDGGKRYRVSFEDGSSPVVEKTGDELAKGLEVTLKGAPVSELIWLEEVGK